MSSSHPYDPSCPDCIPALVDTTTCTLYPREHPVMVAVLKVWNTASFAERKAFMAFSRDNSRDPEVVATAGPLIRRIEAAMARVGSN